MMSRNSERKAPHWDFLNRSSHPSRRNVSLADDTDIRLGRDPRIMSENVVGCTKDKNSPQNTMSAPRLLKSFSARFSSPHSPTESESDSARASSRIKSRFSHVKKMFHSFSRPKSPAILLSSSSQATSENLRLKNDKKTRKSLLDDFPNNPSNPANLHGVFKVENKRGMPLFEFNVKSLDDAFYIAKMRNDENSSTWVYTFHSLHTRSKSNNASEWGSNESNTFSFSSMIGEMQVSCYLKKELEGGRDLENSMVTEFVLYNASSQDSSSSSPNVDKAQYIADPNSSSTKQSNESGRLEIAAIVIEVPVKKREGLKFKGSGKIHVVVPSGRHGLQSAASCGPSPLLERWRRGGGCDCGGWDMACPLNVLGNENVQIAEDHILIDHRHLLELFVQGKNENVAALTVREIYDGQYGVDFQAQLSSLQAFSVCVAVLHTTVASAADGPETKGHMSQCDSLRSVFSKDEVKTLIDSVTEEEEVFSPSFVLDPPFSSVALV